MACIGGRQLIVNDGVGLCDLWQPYSLKVQILGAPPAAITRACVTSQGTSNVVLYMADDPDSDGQILCVLRISTMREPQQRSIQQCLPRLPIATLIDRVITLVPAPLSTRVALKLG